MGGGINNEWFWKMRLSTIQNHLDGVAWSVADVGGDG
jgi:hypothetical protein